jgi:predicted metal-dependent HD superfamily phosphohydrolase
MDISTSGCRPEALEARFFGLWNRCSLPDSDADASAVWAALIESYNEPWRQYHTAEHLCHCLQQLDLASSLMEHPEAVELALWFHDIIIQPDAPNNEEQSAKMFERTAEKHFARDLVKKVAVLIHTTVHRDPPQEQNARYLCDIDLSSLALPWEQFLTDSAALRAEHSETADAPFYRAKIRFLSSLLDRPAIFLTEFFRSRHEHAARENIRRYITELQTKGYS